MSGLVQRISDLQFHSVFITRAGSPINSLRDLMGKQFAFGDINSASAHLIPYRELKQAGINPDTDLKFRYNGNHPATAALVETGAVDAGALDETVSTPSSAAESWTARKSAFSILRNPSWITCTWPARMCPRRCEKDLSAPFWP